MLGLRLRLTSSLLHLAQLTDFLLSTEKEELRAKVQGERVFLIFDGTSRLGEAFALVVRWMNDQFELNERLLSFRTLKSSLNADQLVMHLTSTIVGGGIQLDNVIGFARDGVAVNGKAMRQMQQGMQVPIVDIRCLAHFLDLVGDRYDGDLAEEFMKAWRQATARDKAKSLFAFLVSTSVVASSDVRWWTSWEQVKQVCVLFPVVERFIRHPDAPPSASKMVGSQFPFFPKTSPIVIH